MRPTPGTLRCGKEFSTHGALVLDDFDVLEHLEATQAKNTDIDSSLDEVPVDASPAWAARGSRLRSRSLSPPRRSARLVPPDDLSADLQGRTRAARRAREQVALGTTLKEVVRKRISRAEPIHIRTNPGDYPVTSTGWSGIRERPKRQRALSLPELEREYGMTKLDWDGRSSRPLVDKQQRVIAVLGGRPNDDVYLKLTQDAAAEIEAARDELSFRPQQTNGRRGAYSSDTGGISFGGGQQVPGNLRQSRAAATMFQRLFSLECFLRMAGFANGLFRAWNPAVHALYTLTLDALTSDYNPSLRRNFPRSYSAFAAATINFGPATVTLPHIDCLNLAWGWCSITALGDFDPDLGGHLVLWDLNLIVRFPPGSTILIPSAILKHSNVAIRPGERRYSFTQFSAAGLLRWVDNGFKSDATVTTDSDFDIEAQQIRERARSTRWGDGINSYKRWVF